jgi:hypothetical protein
VRELWDPAVRVLEENWTGRATLPSRDQYPHQWSWDSAFISIGLARVAPDRARSELTSLFRSQWSSGRLPQIVFAENSEGYFPGPQFWRSEATSGQATSGIVQPPVHARAVLATHLADREGSRAEGFLARIFPRLQAWHAYLAEHRDLGQAGLVAIVHPWESGLDNSPAWDHVLAATAASPDSFARRDTTHVDAAHRPTDADYQAYVALAGRYRDSGYADSALGDHDFLVEDPLFNTLLLDAELCMARIAAELGVDDAAHTTAARRLHEALLQRLWDDSAHRFVARDVHTGARSDVATIGSLIPLLDPWLPPAVRDHVAALAASDQFAGGCEFPMPSTALGAAQFDRRRYWRGPTWINTNWLMWLAARQAGLTELADRIAGASLALVAEHGFREYFDPLTGEGLGADRFSWTAALTLDLLAAADADAADVDADGTAVTAEPA